MKNYSRQREAVLQVLRSTTSHPTAAWVYEKVREQLPNISRGTVYRNLTDLVLSGDAIEVAVGDGVQHFDATVRDHIHFRCKACGRIIDCPLPDNKLKQFVEKTLGCSVDSEKDIFHGVCQACLSVNK